MLAAALLHGVVAAVAGEPPKSAAPKAEPVKGAEVAKADAERKKPLQRCDQLKDKAQLDCLQKAREHIAAARQTREGSVKTTTVDPKREKSPH